MGSNKKYSGPQMNYYKVGYGNTSANASGDSRKVINLTDEQEEFIRVALGGGNIWVDACIGSGKTTAIQRLCIEIMNDRCRHKSNILYLTYNNLLKEDARSKLRGVLSKNNIHNYDSFASYVLKRKWDSTAIDEFNSNFGCIKRNMQIYDVLIIDEYQDLESRTLKMIENIISVNDDIQLIIVGDIDQKLYNRSEIEVKDEIERILKRPNRTTHKIEFTKCFRLNNQYAKLFGTIWGKTITGCNSDCEVVSMSIEDTIDELKKYESSSEKVLILGPNNWGDSSYDIIKNRIDNNLWNKRSLFIKSDGGSPTQYTMKHCAIMCTYDSSKGMEREVCVICDFSKEYFKYRADKNPSDKECTRLRNVFCVGASRGSRKIIFVEDPGIRENLMIHVNNGDAQLTGNELTMIKGKSVDWIQEDYISVTELLEFIKDEDIKNLLDAVKYTEIEYEDGIGEIVPNIMKEGEMSYAICIGTYVPACYFEKYTVKKMKETIINTLMMHRELSKLSNDAKEKIAKLENMQDMRQISLFQEYLETNSFRFIDQSNIEFISNENRQDIIKRFESAKFDTHNDVEKCCRMKYKDSQGRIITIEGYIDVINGWGQLYELKFVTELEKKHIWQTAAYMCASGYQEGVVFNVRDGKQYKVKITCSPKEFEDILLNIYKHKRGITSSECSFRVVSKGIVDNKELVLDTKE